MDKKKKKDRNLQVVHPKQANATLSQFLLEKLLEKRQEPEFVEKVKSTYKNCATYLLRKMPINNSMLRHLSAIDPQAQGNEITLCHLKRFPLLISYVLNKEEEQKFGKYTPIM